MILRKSKMAKPVKKTADAATGHARVKQIIARLDKEHPDAKLALDYTSPLELLISLILAAQSHDSLVNQITPALFAKYKSAADYAAADPEIFQSEIHSTGFFRNKTKSILGMAQALEERHGGRVPDTMEALVALPGVGRKTANVVLGNAFGKNEWIVVDTHVGRIAGLLRLTRQTDPVKIERDLMELVPRKDWTIFSHLLILHGRKTCIARRPKCGSCRINDLCPSSRV
jgi:endonuclease-3